MRLITKNMKFITNLFIYLKTYYEKPEKSALCQHVLEHDHVIDWENVEILKFEPHANRRRTAESFLINQKAKEFNVLNRNDGAILPGVYVQTLLNC